MAEFRNNAWQKMCTAELMRCVGLPMRQRKAAWKTARRHFQRIIARTMGQTGTRPTRIILADFDLSGKDVSEFDLSYCYLVRGNLIGSNMRCVSLAQSIVTDCRLANADISGADLGRATIKDTVVGLDSVAYDNRTRFNVRSAILPANLPQALIDRINGDYRRFQDRRKRSWLGRSWATMTNHGRNVWPLVIPVAATYLIFSALHSAFIYWAEGEFDLHSDTPKALLMSSEAMLGIDPSTDMGSNIFWRIAFHSEAAISLLLMALLIAAITHKTTAPAIDA